ncbi:MAG: ATP-binding cassette domain-containing protein [Clostridia bacterium]|nr:ATP-binding cassette domain-containing protein [Lachnospiraceae bacterium]NCC01619.1 ATP-binding cassette domain-containing protein [Clostridia bacterium]NCD02376.1 ATP-binding cassette domain-containing protein [Clostridia bacterium]
MQTLVKMEGITKEFPGVKALDNISLEINAGEVHVLLGENGAGKSTLMKILSGVYKPTSGKITVKGTEYSQLTPQDSYENGISIIYQELSVINELSILENLFVGKLPTRKVAGFPVVDYKFMSEKAKEVLNKVGVHRDPKLFVENISISEKQQVEIAKALVSNADVIIMDEPTTSLTTSETEHLFSIIRQLKSEGKGIVYISHKMKEIKEIGDKVTVLKDGTYVGTRNVAEVEVDDLVAMMVGRKIQGTYLNEECQDFSDKPVFFEVQNISRKDQKVKNVSFQLHKGEILGFAGLVGSGRSELMNAIFGAEPKSEGKIFMEGKELRIRNPYEAIQNGLGMVTENRRETGFLDNFDIKQNISIVPYIKTSKAQGVIGLVNNRNELNYANQQVSDIRVKCRDINQNITELSGGNQQKVILGKWLAAESKLIIFDEPTKGIDVGSKSEIYVLMRKLANEGKGVLVVSSELPELLSVCDTIAVFREGEIRGVFSNAEATEEKIVKTSTGE